MKGYARYEKLMANWADSHILPTHEALQRGEDAPAIDVFFENTFKGFMEIFTTLEALHLNQVFVSLSPPRSRRIKKPDYLKYHVSVYLQEIYILKERLNAYATKILRAYLKANKERSADPKKHPLFDEVKNTMNGLVSTRGSHVHETRHSDDNLDRASMFGMASDANKEFEEAFKLSYKLAKSTWTDRIKKDNEEIKKLLDIYFDAMYEVVAEMATLKLPKR